MEITGVVHSTIECRCYNDQRLNIPEGNHVVDNPLQFSVLPWAAKQEVLVFTTAVH